MTGLPADRQAFSGKSWAQDVRLPLTASTVKASALYLARITRVEVLPRSTKGQLFVLDAWGRQPGLSTAAPLRLSRIDVATATVEEGATQHTVRLPVTVTGPAHTAGRAWVFVIDPDSFEHPRRPPRGRAGRVPAASLSTSRSPATPTTTGTSCSTRCR